MNKEEYSWNCEDWQGRRPDQYESSAECAAWVFILMIIFGIIYWIIS